MNKNYKTIVSLMSGTSADSVDACLVKIFDDLSFEIIDNYTLEYPQTLREKIISTANNDGTVKDVCILNFILGEYFAKCVNLLLKKSELKSNDIDFISSHGQTVCHIPQDITLANITTKSTLQIADISVIAERTGIMTIGDYRTKDIAAGGLGAPLVPFADEILFKKDKTRLIQNIGGISNVTVISPNVKTFAFDNGPGNMLIDYFTEKFFDTTYDKDGLFAMQGKIDENWLNMLLKEPYYSIKPPKTTGRELFNKEYAEKIFLEAPKNKYDVITTITELTSRVIVNSYKDFIFPKTSVQEIIIGGGGAYNKYLLNSMQNLLPKIEIKTHADFGIPDKLKECLAFAYLGYYTINRKANNQPDCTGAKHSVVMGKIAY